MYEAVIDKLDFFYLICRKSSIYMSGSRRGGGGGGVGGGGQEVRIGFLSNAGPQPLKTTKLPSQHSMLGHHPHAN